MSHKRRTPCCDIEAHRYLDNIEGDHDTIARQAAIGAAVERLDRGSTNVTISRWPSGEWTVITATVGSATGWGGPSDLHAAIASVLGDDDE